MLAKGVNVQLDCVVNKISTGHDEAVLVEGVQVRVHAPTYIRSLLSRA